MNKKTQFALPKMFPFSLRLVSTNYALRCDAKYADPKVLAVEKRFVRPAHLSLESFSRNHL
jgi:hypothetical protein